MVKKDQFIIEWLDASREPHCLPNPAYPHGIDIPSPRLGSRSSCRTDMRWVTATASRAIILVSAHMKGKMMPRNASDVAPTIRIQDGAPSPRKSSGAASLVVRRRSLAPVHLLPLRQQLKQRNESQRRQSGAGLQSLEQTAEALLGNNLPGELEITPDRLAVQLGRPKVAKSLNIGTDMVQRISKERSMRLRGAKQ